jgi:hypothetical protein
MIVRSSSAQGSRSYLPSTKFNMGDISTGADTTDSYNIDDIRNLLENDKNVKVAGINADGILRGKVMVKEKFLSSAVTGFGMSSVQFGWDMHDDFACYQRTDHVFRQWLCWLHHHTRSKELQGYTIGR